MQMVLPESWLGMPGLRIGEANTPAREADMQKWGADMRKVLPESWLGMPGLRISSLRWCSAKK